MEFELWVRYPDTLYSLYLSDNEVGASCHFHVNSERTGAQVGHTRCQSKWWGTHTFRRQAFLTHGSAGSQSNLGNLLFILYLILNHQHLPYVLAFKEFWCISQQCTLQHAEDCYKKRKRWVTRNSLHHIFPEPNTELSLELLNLLICFDQLLRSP